MIGLNCTPEEEAAQCKKSSCNCETGMGCTAEELAACPQEAEICPMTCEANEVCDELHGTCVPRTCTVDTQVVCENNVLKFCLNDSIEITQDCGDGQCNKTDIRCDRTIGCNGTCTDQQYCDVGSNTCKPVECS